MNLDEMKQAWQEDPAPGSPPPGLVAQVRERSAKLDRTIRRRDRRETAAAVLLALFFLAALPSSGPLTRVGILLIVATAVLIVVKLRRARRGAATVDPGAPLTISLERERERVGAQIRLLRTVLWWYILPLAVGVVLVFGGGVGWGPLAAAYFMAVAVGAWIVHALNQRAVQSELVPRYEELDALVRQLERGGDA